MSLRSKHKSVPGINLNIGVFDIILDLLGQKQIFK